MKSQVIKRPFLSLVNATFRLGDELVFPNTSWVFGRDEHWAIVGANGSGKSLFADALRGRLPLVGGDLNYQFPPMSGLSVEESIGHVSFESRKASLHGAVVQSRWNSTEDDDALLLRDFLSYERVMDVNPFQVGRSDAGARRVFRQRQQNAIATLNLGDFLKRPLLSLSNGETQRAQLARALSHPMRLLILDEPFIGLDAATRAQFHTVLEKLMTQSLRILLITTRIEDLPDHITHLLYVDSCRIVGAGSRKDVLRTHSKGRAPVPVAAIKPTTRRTQLVRLGDRSPNGEPMVDLRNVTVKYGEATILDNITWAIHRGESWALLGPNGSGKTTLLSMILGDNPKAYSNDVTVFGQRRGEGESIWEIKKQIGWVSPELQLHFDETASCYEVVASGFRETIGLFESLSRSQRLAVKKRLAQFDLASHAETPLFTLSAGEQRMALLARALVKKPPLLILDEPCQGLDPEHREVLLETLDGLLRDGGVTAIFVTHRPDEIPGAVRRVLRLSCGQATISSR